MAVLDASVGQFRVYGFADTTTEQLCVAAGVRRSSLYNTFVSKDELFVRSLERSVSLIREQLEAVLTSPGRSGIERLEALFSSILEEEAEARKEGHAAGCMIVASRMAPDLGAREPRVQRILDRFHDYHLSLVTGAVRIGRGDGSLRADVTPGDAALAIVSATFGMRVLSQSGATLDELRRVADLHLDSVRA
ncbi:TetR/AcrR family transcriptional regulator [Streptomyces sp. Z26]|uniref:TetR/AcrR family transcriptional regulator n=1 Tax=Streptomyces sp. Z26 TaxID=2500177 RepID=UPI001F0BD4EE|nr:TetR/AcrR family transcriptional regulator [Streptomyces sp. Z26]